MKSGVYLLLPEAERDLTETGSYLLESASEPVMLRFVRSVFTSAALLATMSGMGLHCRFKKPELSAVRRFPVRSFEQQLIFYRPTDTGIEILRILHSSRDWHKLFA